MKRIISFIAFIIFIICIIFMAVFHNNLVVIWSFGVVAAIMIFIFAYFHSTYLSENNKGFKISRIMHHLYMNKNRSGIDELIYELYSKRSQSTLLREYKEHIKYINFMLDDLENVEFDIELINDTQTIFLRYDEHMIRIDDSLSEKPIYIDPLNRTYNELLQEIDEKFKNLFKLNS